jgi:hypothetical protein
MPQDSPHDAVLVAEVNGSVAGFVQVVLRRPPAAQIRKFSASSTRSAAGERSITSGTTRTGIITSASTIIGRSTARENRSKASARLGFFHWFPLSPKGCRREHERQDP